MNSSTYARVLQASSRSLPFPALSETNRVSPVIGTRIPEHGNPSYPPVGRIYVSYMLMYHYLDSRSVRLLFCYADCPSMRRAPASTLAYNRRHRLDRLDVYK